MPLTIGTQLGSHEITGLLGRGGMGEVYRGRDSRLKRDVAIKILPDEFSRDPERVLRFQREAEVLASLNHPNIAAIYNLEQAGGTRFLVLELVEGETLAERIQRGPIPVEEALEIARQICEALEGAHEKGIVHRDLKPANVKITPDGRVKVLDFGLAKAMENTPASTTLSNSPTMTIGATQAGVILGTAAYMSPEQAKGFQADMRSDVFAFGSVFFEMLTGRQAFHGDTVAEILASVLVREPDFALVPPNLNPRIQELLQRCFQKNPKRRWQAVADLRAELETIARAPRVVAASATEGASQQPAWKWLIPAAVSAIIISMIAGFVGWSLKPAAPPAQIVRFSLTIPDPNMSLPRRLIALSPDDSKLAYVTTGGMFLRVLSEMETHRLSDAPGGVEPFFSSDGQWLGFYSVNEGLLKKVPVMGGAAITLCKTGTVPFGARWDDNKIVFGDLGGIKRVSDAGGEPEVLVKVTGDEIASSPQLLDHGRTVLFTLRPSAASPTEQSQIVVQPLPAGDRKVISRGVDAHYLPSGHLVYSIGGNVMAVAFDEKRLETAGAFIPVVEGVQRTGSFSQLSISDRGGLIFIPGEAGTGVTHTELALADRSGKLQTLQLPPAAYEYPRISPDGKTLAVGIRDGNERFVSLYDLSGAKSPLRLTFGGSDTLPVWSRDSRYVYFRSDRDGKIGLFRQAADGRTAAERLTEAESTDTRHNPLSIDPLGKVLTFEYRRELVDSDIWLLPLEGDRKPRPLLVQPYFQSLAAFSSDGNWLAYMSNELSGFGPQIFVQTYPITAEKHQVTTRGGAAPLWSPVENEKKLFYYWNGKLYSVDIQTEPSFGLRGSSPLPITGAQQTTGAPRNYDITPDGKQFIVVLAASQNQKEQSAQPQINVWLNWGEELKRRVPVK
jgi:eukaryotic-like serine/threonine-protein kinase